MQVPAESAGLKPGPVAIVAGIFRHEGLAVNCGSDLLYLRKSDDTPSYPPNHAALPPVSRIKVQMIAGATAGISYNFLFYPADTIKSRMQTVDISQLGAERAQVIPHPRYMPLSPCCFQRALVSPQNVC
jgi:ornithine carrier protein